MSLNLAVLGLGAMGSRMATRLLQAGHRVTVWNRSPGPAQALVQAGAHLADSPRAAAAQAEFVIAMVRDDAASQQVWCDPQTGALGGMAADALAIESSTLSLAGMRALAAASARHGVALLDAPVSGSRPAAAAGQLVYLVGGEADSFSRAQALLRTLGSAAHHVGPVGHGTLAKLVTNALLGLHVTALAELIGLLTRQGVAPGPLLEAVSATPVWAPVDHALSASMLGGDFRPQFPVELIAKDFGYAQAASGGPGQAPLLAAALGVFERAQQQGLGGENMTAVARLYTASPAA